MTTIVSRDNPLKHYAWGKACDGWNLVDEPLLSVKLEKMPPNTAEWLHYHEKAQQFFFILKGEALFEIGEGRFVVREQQSVHIRAGQSHRILNECNEDLEFLLSSQPSTTDDRINRSHGKD